MNQTFSLAASIGKRFLRGFLAGAVSTMATVTIMATNFRELGQVLAALGLSAIIGGLTGGILALDKWARSVSSEDTY
jgi:hypothetical protein